MNLQCHKCLLFKILGYVLSRRILFLISCVTENHFSFCNYCISDRLNTVAKNIPGSLWARRVFTKVIGKSLTLDVVLKNSPLKSFSQSTLLSHSLPVTCAMLLSVIWKLAEFYINMLLFQHRFCFRWSWTTTVLGNTLYIKNPTLQTYFFLTTSHVTYASMLRWHSPSQII